jgi:hypothetical protein
MQVHQIYNFKVGGCVCSQILLFERRVSCIWQNIHMTKLINLIDHRNQIPRSIYVCREQSSVWRLPIDPLPPLHPAGVFFPAPKAGGEGVGGSIFWKTPDIGLASYSIIPLRQIPTPVILE